MLQLHWNQSSFKSIHLRVLNLACSCIFAVKKWSGAPDPKQFRYRRFCYSSCGKAVGSALRWMSAISCAPGGWGLLTWHLHSDSGGYPKPRLNGPCFKSSVKQWILGCRWKDNLCMNMHVLYTHLCCIILYRYIWYMIVSYWESSPSDRNAGRWTLDTKWSFKAHPNQESFMPSKDGTPAMDMTGKELQRKGFPLA